MDIFTTQLTRVVPVPIKPASLKVKALLKEAASSKLDQDPDHLENHEYYFAGEEDQYHGGQGADSEAKQQGKGEAEKQAAEQSTEYSIEKNKDSDKGDTKSGTNHLDLYA